MPGSRFFHLLWFAALFGALLIATPEPDAQGFKAKAKDPSMFKGKAESAVKGGQPRWMEDPRARTPPVKWIDVHMHLVGPNATALEKTAQMALADMDRYGVAASVIMPTLLSPYEYEAFIGALRKRPDRFAFMGGTNKLHAFIYDVRPEKVTESMKRQFVAYAESVLKAGGRGWGEMATLHFSLADGHKYLRAEPDHPMFLALAEVAGRHGAVIDVHHDPIVATQPLPGWLKSPPNPKSVPDNMAAFERLLAHDRGAKIVWAHGGLDPFGGMTSSLVGELMERHPNLFMSLRVPAPPLDVVPGLGLKIHNKLLHPSGVDRGWLAVLQRFPNRFVIGTDSFFIVEGSQAATTAFVAANESRFLATNLFLSSIPRELAQKIAVENATRLYKLDLKK